MLFGLPGKSSSSSPGSRLTCLKVAKIDISNSPPTSISALYNWGAPGLFIYVSVTGHGGDTGLNSMGNALRNRPEQGLRQAAMETIFS